MMMNMMMMMLLNFVATDPAKMKSFRNKSIFATDGQGRLVIQEGEVDALADNLSEQLLVSC